MQLLHCRLEHEENATLQYTAVPADVIDVSACSAMLVSQLRSQHAVSADLCSCACALTQVLCYVQGVCVY